MSLQRRFGVLVALLCGLMIHSVEGQQNRTWLPVEFEFMLEVNSTARTNGVEAVDEELSIWLSSIDKDMVPRLQERLPNGKQNSNNNQLPDVKYNRVSSTIINRCFTESDACQWVKSTVFLTYQGQKPDFSVERVTLGLVKDFLGQFSKERPKVRATYTFPMLVSGSGRFEIGPVNRTMDTVEIEVFEKSFDNVFSAIVLSFDGDTEVTEANFIYQDINQVMRDGQVSNALSVDVIYFGRCRYCDNAQFVDMVDGVIKDPMILEAFQNRLKYDGEGLSTDYFDDVSFSAYSKRTMPDKTPTMVDASIYDSQAPVPSNNLPWYLWFGLVLVVLILGAGGYFIYRDHRELMKEERSTDEDASYDDEDSGDRSLSTNDSDDFIIDDGGDDYYTDEATEIPSRDGPAESTVVSYNEEPPTADGKQTQEYEIYVY